MLREAIIFFPVDFGISSQMGGQPNPNFFVKSAKTKFTFVNGQKSDKTKKIMSPNFSGSLTLLELCSGNLDGYFQ